MIPKQCLTCINFNVDESLCRVYEQLPGEYGREQISDCPSYLDKSSKDSDELKMLIQYMEEDAGQIVLNEKIEKAVSNILDGYQTKYKVMIVGIARRKIKSIIKMVDIVDTLLDKLSDHEVLTDMAPSQAIRLLSELNHSMNNDLSFIMKLVDPSTKLDELQMLIDNRSVAININGTSMTTDAAAEEILRVSATSRDKIRDAFDALLYQVAEDDKIDISKIDLSEVADEGGADDEE